MNTEAQLDGELWGNRSQTGLSLPRVERALV